MRLEFRGGNRELKNKCIKDFESVIEFGRKVKQQVGEGRGASDGVSEEVMFG